MLPLPRRQEAPAHDFDNVRRRVAETPAAINSGQVIIIAAWIAQTFPSAGAPFDHHGQQTVQYAASDARAAKEFADTETILDRLDVNAASDIRDVLDAIDAIGNPAGASQTHPTPPRQTN